MIIFVVETLRANGSVLPSNAYFERYDALDEALEVCEAGDACCDKNDGDDEFDGTKCPGGCTVRSPRIVEYTAERIEK